MTDPEIAGPIAMFVERCRDAVRWRANAVRQRALTWRAESKAKATIRALASMKRANPGRAFCGILLIEHIGDIIACEPVIAQVRTAHPNAFLVWLVRPEFSPLVASHPGLDAIVCVDSFLSVERIVESRIFDHEVDLHVNGKPTEVGGRAYRKTSGDPTIDLKTYIGQGSLLRSFSLAAGIEPHSAGPTMYLPSDAARAIDRLALPDHYVVVHATPNYGAKDWAAPKWRDFVRHILDNYDTHVIEVGLKRVIDLEHPRFASLCGKLSIVETAEVIRRCAFFVGVDSGPAHMANAWRRPALLLFGRFSGSDSFNPFDGYYGEEARTVIFRCPGLLREQPASAVIAALEASPMWKETHGARAGGSTAT